MTRSYSEEEKMAYVEEFKNSELGATTFARQNGIPESTFRGWIKDVSDLSFGKRSTKRRIETSSQIRYNTDKA